MERDWKKEVCREREKEKTARVFEETITKWTTHLFVILWALGALSEV